MNDDVLVLDRLLSTAWPPQPYPGLRPFEMEEWSIFFGRERMIDDVIELLARHRLVVVYGASGSGKSSLIRAGVLPRLARQYLRHSVPWRTAAMRPSGGPLWNLALAIACLEGHDGEDLRVETIRRAFDRPGARLRDVVASEVGPAGQQVCVLVDQFEELFRYAREISRDESQLFIELLTGLTEDDGDSGVHVVVTLRSEFLGECARYDGLAEAVNRTQYLLPRMDREGLRRAIRRPAELYGGTVDVDLAERLVTDAGGSQDELPLIQHALLLLWNQASGETGSQRRLGLDLYRRQGDGVAALLSDHASRVMAAVAPDPPQQTVVEVLFRALTDINAEGQGIRRPQRFDRLVAVTGGDREMLRGIINAFRAEGVSFLTPYPPEEVKNATVIDISHEALIRGWQRLRGWIDQDKEFLRTRARVAAQAQLWEEENRSPERLLPSGRPLAEGQDLLDKRGADLEPLIVQYIDASKAAEAERQRQRHDQIRRSVEQELAARRFRRITLVVTILALLSTLFASWVGYSSREVIEQRARMLAMSADLATKNSDGRQAMLLALEALPEKPGPIEWLRRPILPEAVRALERALFRPFGRTLDAHTDRLVRVAYSPDGSTILTASEDRTVRIWDAAPAIGSVPRLKLQHGSAVGSARFSRDGRFIITAGQDGWANIWRASDGVKLKEWQISVGRATFVDISPDNRMIAAVAYGDNAGLWSWDPDQVVAEGSVGAPPRKIGELRDADGVTHPEGTNYVTFDASGERLATTSWGGSARVWNSGDRSLLRTLTRATGDHQGSCPEERQGHCGPVTFAAFSAANPDHLVTTSHDRTGRIWELSTGKVIRSLVGHERPVTDAAFIGDGKRVMTAALDGTVRIWDTMSGEPLQVLQGPSVVAGTTATAALSPDERTVVASFANPSAYVWVVRGDLQPFVLSRLTGAAPSAALSPDNRLLVVATNISVEPYDAESGRAVGWPLYFDAAPMSLAISPDGNDLLLANGGRADVLRIDGWSEGAAPRRLRQLHGHDGLVLSAVYSADGKRIVTASADGTARLWSAGTGKPTAEPMHHRDAVFSATFDRAGQRALTASFDGTVRIWTVDEGALVRLIDVGSPALEATFTADGRHVVVTTLDVPSEPLAEPPFFRTETALWDAETGQRLGEQLQNVKFLQLANLVVVGTGDGLIWLFSPLGDDLIRLFSALDAEPVAVLPGHRDSISRIVASPGGERLATISADGMIRVWRLPPANPHALVEYANGIADQYLGPEQRQFSDRERDALGLSSRSPDLPSLKIRVR